MINFDPNSLNSVFDKNFGAGSFNTGLSNAAKSGRLKAQASFAKQDFLQRLSDYQAKLKQDQAYMDKYGMTKDQYDAQQAQKKQNSTFNSAMNYWNDTSRNKDLHNKGAYQAANDLINNPQTVEDLKNQGYDVNKIVDAAYNVASNGKFASKKAYDQYATELDKSNTNKKANMDSIDLYLQKAKAQEQQQSTPKQPSTLDNIKNGFMKAVDIVSRPDNAVLTGLDQKLKGGSFLQGAKQGFLGQTHTNPVNVLHDMGIDPSKNKVVKTAENFLGHELINQVPVVGKFAAPFVNNTIKNNLGEQLAGTGLASAVDPLNLLGLGGLSKLKKGAQAADEAAQLLKLSGPQERLGLPAPTQRMGLPGPDSPLGLPSPQLRLNSPVKEPLGLPAPQLQLAAPKPVQSSLDTLLNAGKKPGGLQSPVPQMPTTMRLAQLKNSGVGFGYNSKLEPAARTGVPSANLPRYTKEALGNKADQILNDVTNVQNKPSNYYEKRLLSTQKDMQTKRQTTQDLQKEFKDAVQGQYQYLKNSMGKGVSRGTTSNGLAGNFKQVTGRFNVSNNPKWYQDFYRQYGRRPNDTELRQLAEQQVRNGFQDEYGNVPAYVPKQVENINNQLDEISTILAERPDQEHILAPYVQALEQDRQTILDNYNKAINGHSPTIDELYNQVRSQNDPSSFDHLVRMNQLETNLTKNKPVQGPKFASEMAANNPLPAPAEPKISRLATLDEMVNHLQGMTPPKQTVQEPLPLNFKKQVVAKANRGQEPPLQFKKTIPNPALQAKKDVSNSPLLLNPSSLKPENLLKTTSTAKTLDKMSKDELQTVYKQLQDKKASLAAKKTKASKKQMAAVEEDLKKVNNFLMKSDLQMFGKGSKKKPTTGESITPREKKAQKKAVADFVDKAKKAGIDPAVRKEAQNLDNAGAMLKGAKNINQMADKLPKETGDKIKASLNTVEELKNAKDILPTQTLTKNIYELADKLPKSIGDTIKKSLDKAKTAHVNNIEQRTNTLNDKVVKGLGIQKGSKESALVQDFGEKTLGKKYLRSRGIDPSKLSEQELSTVNLQQLKKQHPDNWQKIVAADNFFKQDYKKMIDEVNATVKKIYPNNPDKLVPMRKDYYHHFNELQGFEGFKNMIQHSSAIDPHLAGISADTKPNSKWQGFKQMRKNGTYKSDAVGGYLKYLQAASHSTHIDPMIKVLRNAADQIASATSETRNLNNIKSALEVHANNLAGKTNPVDRLFQDHVVGRKIMNVANVINGHIKKNMILGNLGSALGQVGNVPLAVGKAKQFAAQGAMDTLKYAATHLPGASKDVSSPINQSQFLKERFSHQLFTRFDNGLLKKPEKMAAWLIETADKSGTYFTWNSMYRKGLAQGVTDPIKYADTETRHIVAGRGIGEVPIAQRSKIMQLVAPFSLEVGNQWKVLGKQLSEKDFGGIITFLAASYGLNVAMNKSKGSDASYNPIGAIIQGINKDPNASGMDKAKSALANLAGETVGNIPGGNYLPQLLGLANNQAKQTIFGDRSPDRFGTGVGVASTVFKPGSDAVAGNWKQAGKDLLPLVMPFGGNQVKKTAGGIEALAKGGAYNNQGKLQYPVDSSNPADVLHSLMFGSTTTPQGQDYYNKKQSPLSDKQTAAYQNSPDKQAFFNDIQNQRQAKAIQKKIQDIQKDPSMSPDEKLKAIFLLTKQLQNN